MVEELCREEVDGIPDVPVYATGDAVSLLRRMVSGAAWQTAMDVDDQAAIRWALERLRQEAHV